MTVILTGKPVPSPQQSRTEALRAEAAIDPPAPATAPPTKQTQIIAIYGKGGIGKSFTLANLSYMMAQQGKRALLIGCDPKSDTTSLLFGGKSCPTIIETSSRKKAAGEEVRIGDVCFKRDGVFAMDLARRTRLAANFATSRGHAGIAATAQTDFDVQRNGTSIGTVRFPAGSATATWGC
jgi:chlorophyllide a reductase subunit X